MKTSFEITSSLINTNISIYIYKANQQRLFNKFVREKVENRLGKDFLLLHEIQEINGDIMEEIKSNFLISE